MPSAANPAFCIGGESECEVGQPSRPTSVVVPRISVTRGVSPARLLRGAAPTVVAIGLDNPRGLTFGADGTLYVAEAGRGGSGPCFVSSEPNLVCLGATGAITQVREGTQTRIATGLPSLAGAGGDTPPVPSFAEADPTSPERPLVA